VHTASGLVVSGPTVALYTSPDAAANPREQTDSGLKLRWVGDSSAMLKHALPTEGPLRTDRARPSPGRYAWAMCRNIRTLYNFDPPASDEEIRSAALQYVRKISGFNKPSRANEDAFQRALDAVTEASSQLLSELETNAPPKDRDVEAAKAKARAAQRYAAA
jgi:hypothetical protein